MEGPPQSFFHNHPWMKAEREAQRAAQRMEGVPPSALPDASPDAPAGVPIGSEAREVLEPRLGGDLSQVRLHAGPDGAQAAAAAGARAVTIGSRVAFAAGEYRPGTPEGRQMLGHELAHAVQQAGGGHGLSAVPGPTAQGYCDPTIESCPPDEMVCTEESAPELPPIDAYSVPADFDVVIEIAGPPDVGGGANEPELLRLEVPVYHTQREDLYALPAEWVFPTPDAAAAGYCPVPGGMDESGGGSTSSPTGPSLPSGPTPPSLTSGGTAEPVLATPEPPLFLPGQIAYTPDGAPIEILSARGSYLFTRVYTKYAVGAGSTTLVLTQNGYVLVDAGMHQVGGRINDALADATIERLERDLAGAPLEDALLTHMHADHWTLLPRVYARWEIGTLRVNAIQAFLPGTGGRTQLENLVEAMIEARRVHVEAQVRGELTSSAGPWDLYVDETLRQQALDEAVGAETARRLQAMRPTAVHLDIPSGGQVVAANMPIGRIALPAGLRAGGGPITQGLIEPGMLTLLHPESEGMLSDVLSGRAPREGVDAASTTYVIDMPNGWRLFVLSDPRVPDLLEIMSGFEAQLARLGPPAAFQIWDETHHMQRGWREGSAMTRGRDLVSLSEMLARVADARAAQHAQIGDAVVVSVHGSPDAPARPNYVDPSLMWLLQSMNYNVLPATGGGDVATAAQDVALLEVVLGERRVSGLVGGAYSSLQPEDVLGRRAAAAMALERDAAAELEAELSGTLTPDRRAEVERQLTETRARHTALREAYARYDAAVSAAIGRGPRESRPAVAPALGDQAPAETEAAALRALLADYTQPVVGESPRFTGAALVVIGQEQLLTLTPAEQSLLATRARVQELAAAASASGGIEDRNALISALDAYRTSLRALLTDAPRGTQEVLEFELARIDEDLVWLTGYSLPEIESLREAAALVDRVESNVIEPAVVENPAEITEPARVREIIESHDGRAIVGGRLLEVSLTGEAVSMRPVEMVPISVPRGGQSGGGGTWSGGGGGSSGGGGRGGRRGGSWAELFGERPAQPLATTGPTSLVPGGSLPGGTGTTGSGGGPSRGLSVVRGIAAQGPVPTLAEFLAQPNIVNFSGRPIFIGGRTLAPTPWEPIGNARPGDIVIRGFGEAWFLTDPVTGRPLAGVFQGGEWWRLGADGRWTLEVDSQGSVQREGATRAINVGVYGRRVPVAEQAAGSRYSRGQQAVAVGVGIIVVANEILGQLGQIQQVQRHNLQVRRSRMELWARFGALRGWEMRNQNGDEVQAFGTEADTSTFGDPVYHYVTEIDLEALHETMVVSIQTYQDLMIWLDMAVTIGAIEMDPPWLTPTFPTAEERARPRRVWAKIDGPAGTNAMLSLEITHIIDEIEQRELAEIQEEMQARVAGWGEGEQANIYRLASGSETAVYRSANGQRIMSAGHTFGPDPLVRPVGNTYGDSLWERVNGWNHAHGNRVLVEPANADAQRTALLSSYIIWQNLEDTLAEVTAADRPILERQYDPVLEDELASFVAGPAPDDPRFGMTRYYRHQQEPRRWTIAIGQLNHFWVDEDELRPLTPQPAEPEQSGSVEPTLDPDRHGIVPPVHGTVERAIPGRIDTSAESVTYNPTTGVITGRRMQ